MRFRFWGPLAEEAKERRKTFSEYQAFLIALFKTAAAVIITGVLLLMLWVAAGIVKS